MQSAEERETKTNDERDKYIHDRELMNKKAVLWATVWIVCVISGGILFVFRHELKELILTYLK